MAVKAKAVKLPIDMFESVTGFWRGVRLCGRSYNGKKCDGRPCILSVKKKIPGVGIVPIITDGVRVANDDGTPLLFFPRLEKQKQAGVNQ